MSSFDAVLLLSFGGPEGPDDVLPFMEQVTKGRGIPRERLQQVSAHYQLFGGVSPINEHNRALLAALQPALHAHGVDLPVYWGNRNWHPFLADTVRQMRDDGITRALVFVTSAYASASGCHQYRDNLVAARLEVGEGAPLLEKIRTFHNHPGFVLPFVDAVVAAVAKLSDRVGGAAGLRLAFTAHSIPLAMSDTSAYVEQLRDTATLVVAGFEQATGITLPWELVFQSRSGAPGTPWLEPDICEHLEMLQLDGATGVVVVPIGFVSDHMEVVYDLDTQASDRAIKIGLPFERAATPGTDPRFVEMICELIIERLMEANGQPAKRRWLGSMGAAHDVCPDGCCPIPQEQQRPPR